MRNTTQKFDKLKERFQTELSENKLPVSSLCLSVSVSPAADRRLSLPQAGVGAAAAQPAEAHVAESQRPVPGVPAPPHEGHAEDRERAVVGTAPPGGGDEEEGPGTRTLGGGRSFPLRVSTRDDLLSGNRTSN